MSAHRLPCTPRSPTRRGWVLGLWLVALAAPACEEVSRDAEAERRIAAEQVVIRAYADKVPAVDQKLKAFLSAWERANEHKDVKGLKDDLTANVKPAIAAHLEALAAMPTGSPELAAIHAPLVAAYRDAAAAFDRFIAEVREEDLDAQYARLIGAMDNLKAAEDRYLTALESYYAKHRMTLKKGP